MMTTTVLYRAGHNRSIPARLWAAFSALLMTLAHANVRARSVEPFGL
jgi:hypothetical protein